MSTISKNKNKEGFFRNGFGILIPIVTLIAAEVLTAVAWLALGVISGVTFGVFSLYIILFALLVVTVDQVKGEAAVDQVKGQAETTCSQNPNLSLVEGLSLGPQQQSAGSSNDNLISTEASPLDQDHSALLQNLTNELETGNATAGYARREDLSGPKADTEDDRQLEEIPEFGEEEKVPLLRRGRSQSSSSHFKRSRSIGATAENEDSATTPEAVDSVHSLPSSSSKRSLSVGAIPRNKETLGQSLATPVATATNRSGSSSLSFTGTRSRKERLTTPQQGSASASARPATPASDLFSRDASPSSSEDRKASSSPSFWGPWRQQSALFSPKKREKGVDPASSRSSPTSR